MKLAENNYYMYTYIYLLEPVQFKLTGLGDTK